MLGFTATLVKDITLNMPKKTKKSTVRLTNAHENSYFSTLYVEYLYLTYI